MLIYQWDFLPLFMFFSVNSVMSKYWQKVNLIRFKNILFCTHFYDRLFGSPVSAQWAEQQILKSLNLIPLW